MNEGNQGLVNGNYILNWRRNLKGNKLYVLGNKKGLK